MGPYGNTAKKKYSLTLTFKTKAEQQQRKISLFNLPSCSPEISDNDTKTLRENERERDMQTRAV